MSIKKIEMQGADGTIFYPHTDASVVKHGETTIDVEITEMNQKMDNMTPGMEVNYNSSDNSLNFFPSTNADDAADLVKVVQTNTENISTLTTQQNQNTQKLNTQTYFINTTKVVSSTDDVNEVEQTFTNILGYIPKKINCIANIYGQNYYSIGYCFTNQGICTNNTLSNSLGKTYNVGSLIYFVNDTNITKATITAVTNDTITLKWSFTGSAVLGSIQLSIIAD